MFPRIYYGSTTIALNKIREEFPDLVLVFDNDVDKIINNYSKFFDSFICLIASFMEAFIETSL